MHTNASPRLHEPVPTGERRRLPRPRLTAAIAAVLGVFVAAFGAAVAIRHLTKAGLTWTNLFGLLVSTVGLAMLG